MLTLFVVTTGEGWPSIRQNSMDTTEQDQGPLPFYRVEVKLIENLSGEKIFLNFRLNFETNII